MCHRRFKTAEGEELLMRKRARPAGTVGERTEPASSACAPGTTVWCCPAVGACAYQVGVLQRSRLLHDNKSQPLSSDLRYSAAAIMRCPWRPCADSLWRGSAMQRLLVQLRCHQATTDWPGGLAQALWGGGWTGANLMGLVASNPVRCVETGAAASVGRVCILARSRSRCLGASCVRYRLRFAYQSRSRVASIRAMSAIMPETAPPCRCTHSAGSII